MVSGKDEAPTLGGLRYHPAGHHPGYPLHIPESHATMEEQTNILGIPIEEIEWAG
ncbi:MAG: hypothetical protein IZT59_12580 [Verrucomicrobia bacterium]|nr:hypothetical protein [Verrucomicrobiota bacterium]